MFNAPVLVLNQNYEALNVCDIRRAFRLLGAEKAELNARNHQVIHTPTRAFDAPSVIRLVYLVKRPRPRVKLSRREVFARAWNPQIGSFVETFDGGEVDASLLLLAEIGFVRPDDPRYLGTVAAIEQRLKRGRHLLRYNGADDFGAPTMSFTICTFWYIEALAAVGRREEARDIFEHMLASRNHVGLLSEDLDPATGELWGNFPQSYSMVGLILSAMRLSKSWEESVWRVS